MSIGWTVSLERYSETASHKMRIVSNQIHFRNVQGCDQNAGLAFGKPGILNNYFGRDRADSLNANPKLAGPHIGPGHKDIASVDRKHPAAGELRYRAMFYVNTSGTVVVYCILADVRTVKADSP
jgi:hypothetical protein